MDRHVDYGEESIDWLIDTTACQTVPERDQALHDNLGVRIRQETLAVKGSCLLLRSARQGQRLVVGGDRAATTQQQ